MRGIKYGSGFMMWLTFLKSMHRQTVPSDFRTGTMGEDQGLVDGTTVPDSCNTLTSSHSWPSMPELTYMGMS